MMSKIFSLSFLKISFSLPLNPNMGLLYFFELIWIWVVKTLCEILQTSRKLYLSKILNTHHQSNLCFLKRNFRLTNLKLSWKILSKKNYLVIQKISKINSRWVCKWIIIILKKINLIIFFFWIFLLFNSFDFQKTLIFHLFNFFCFHKTFNFPFTLH